MFTKRNIYEYDIYKANISCLLEMGEINQEQYNMLKDIPKDERAKFVAAFEKLEDDTSKGYHIFVEKSLEKFKKFNNIEKENIIEIAFDAIWIDKEVNNLEVTENIKFTCKRKASSILEIGKVKFYYNSNNNTSAESSRPSTPSNSTATTETPANSGSTTIPEAPATTVPPASTETPGTGQ